MTGLDKTSLASPTPAAAYITSPRSLSASKLEFELYVPGPRDVLRAVLISCVESSIASWRFVRSLGFGSTPSIKVKCPYYKSALRHPGRVPPSLRLRWLLEVSSRLSQPTEELAKSTPQHNSSSSSQHSSARVPAGRPRPRPRYWRDAFGPGVVMPLNLFLGWLLINAELINIRVY